MLESTPAQRFSALGNDLRLGCFRYVIRAGAAGRSAGDIARHLGVAPSTLSSHLATLQRCGLLSSRRERQRVIYTVDAEVVRSLIGFLVDDCCQGRPELCGLATAGETTDACR